MSGPKSYDYDVDYETAEQIKERLRREQEARELELAHKKYRDSLSAIVGTVYRIKDEINKIKNIEKESGKKINSYLSAENLCEIVLTYVNNNKSKRFNHMDLVKNESSHVGEYKRQLEYKFVEVGDILSRSIKEVVNDMDSKISGDNMEFTFLKEENEEVSNPYPAMIEDKLDEIKGMTLSKELFEKADAIRYISQSSVTLDESKTLYSIMTLPYIKECTTYNQEYDDLLLKYEVLLSELGKKKDSFEREKDPVEALKDEIDKLEKDLLKKKEQEYINQCLEEVMAEMGYDLIGTRNVVKKSGKKFRNELYKFEEGTVVNVTIQDNGQVSMELGGVDTSNRSATKEEAKALVEDMEEFCEDALKIKQLMESKGIKVKNNSHLPPTVEHAQIINIAGYQLSEDVNKFTVRKEKNKRNKKELKTFKED